MPDDDIRFPEDLLREVVHVSFVIDDFLDTGVYENLGTERAGEGGGVDRSILHTRSEVRRLCDSVLFRVHTAAQFMPSARRYIHQHSETTFLLTVGDSSGGSVVSCGKDMAILYDDSSDLASETGGPGGSKLCHFHEILIAGRPFHDFLMMIRV